MDGSHGSLRLEHVVKTVWDSEAWFDPSCLGQKYMEL